MVSYGNAFKTIRLIKDIRLDEAAHALGIDEQTLRDIESGKTKLISERFDSMLHFYQIDREVVFDLAENQGSLHNVVHEAKRDGIVVNQAGLKQSADAESKKDFEKRITALEVRCQRLEENEQFLKELILNLSKRLG